MSSARGFLCGRSALKYKRENRNFLYQTFLFRFLGFCLFLSVWPKDMRGRPRKVKSISGARRVVGCVQQGVRGVPSGPAAKPFFNVALSGGGCVYPGLLTQRSSAPEHSRQLSRGVAKWFAGLPVWVAVCRGDAILILAIENIGSLVCA